MKWPIIDKTTQAFFPTKNECPICQTDRTTLDGECYVLNGGGLSSTNNHAEMESCSIDGFLSIAYHS